MYYIIYYYIIFPPAPLLLGAAEPVEGQLGHELPRRHAGKVGGGLQHLAAVYGHIRSDSISRLLQTCRVFHRQTSWNCATWQIHPASWWEPYAGCQNWSTYRWHEVNIQIQPLTIKCHLCRSILDICSWYPVWNSCVLFPIKEKVMELCWILCEVAPPSNIVCSLSSDEDDKDNDCCGDRKKHDCKC